LYDYTGRIAHGSGSQETTSNTRVTTRSWRAHQTPLRPRIVQPSPLVYKTLITESFPNLGDRQTGSSRFGGSIFRASARPTIIVICPPPGSERVGMLLMGLLAQECQHTRTASEFRRRPGCGQREGKRGTERERRERDSHSDRASAGNLRRDIFLIFFFHALLFRQPVPFWNFVQPGGGSACT
jgi:hypothetical protein